MFVAKTGVAEFRYKMILRDRKTFAETLQCNVSTLKFFCDVYYAEILLPPTFPYFAAGVAATFRKTDFLPAY